MKLFELNAELTKKFKGAEWNLYSCRVGVASAYTIVNAIKELLPEKYRQYISYRDTNKHIVVCFETYVAHRLIKYVLFDIDVRTKLDKTYNGFGKKFIIDHFDYDLMTKYYGDYKGESDDISALLDFVLELAKKDAAKLMDYKSMAVECVKSISATMNATGWTELANMINYMKSNFSSLYNEAGINKDE